MITIPFDPVAIQIGPFELRWYGMFLSLAVVWLVVWMWLQVRRGAKISMDTVLTLALVGIPSGVIFARLMHVFDDIVVQATHGGTSIYWSNPVSIIGGSGLTAYGAVLGAALGVWTFCRISKIKIGYTFDLVAPGVISAQAIGRLGCIFNGCCPGVQTDVPWGLFYTYPTSPGFGTGVTEPAVVYELFYNLAVFALLLKLRGKFKPDGSLFVIYLALYSAWRVGIDFVRVGQPFFLGLHQAQFIGIVVLLITVPWMLKNMRLAKPELPVALPPETKTPA